MVLKISQGNLKQRLANIENKWNSIESSFPFDFYFLDKTFGAMYKREKKMGKTFIYFTFIAIFIACLGLFGLASFLAEQRRKEIGIRKTLGQRPTV